MGRLVEPVRSVSSPSIDDSGAGVARKREGDKPTPSFATQGTAETAGGDGYWERVAKYIPGEIVAGYLSIIGILKTVPVDDTALLYVAWGAFFLCLILTPIYFRAFAKQGQPRRVHMIVSTLAFAFWAYALGGVFEMIGWHKPWLGSILLVAFTLVSGAIPPEKAKGES